MYSTNKSTQPIGNRDKPLPHSHRATDQRIHCFSNRWAIFFHLGILPLTTASVFSQIQLESFTDVPASSQRHWGFVKLSVLRWRNTTAFGLRERFHLGSHMSWHSTRSKHQPHLLTSTLPHNVPPIKARSSFTTQLFQPNRLWLLFTKLTMPNLQLFVRHVESTAVNARDFFFHLNCLKV